MESITRLHKLYNTPQQKFMSAKDAINLMTKDSTLGLTSKQAKYCLGFCKMTTVEEVTEFDLYNRVAHVEFLEMLGRIAHIKFAGTVLEDEPLATKTEYVLDELLKMIEVQRNDVPIVENEESDSDDDY